VLQKDEFSCWIKNRSEKCKEIIKEGCGRNSGKDKWRSGIKEMKKKM
jgi:hypothetical protein